MHRHLLLFVFGAFSFLNGSQRAGLQTKNSLPKMVRNKGRFKTSAQQCGSLCCVICEVVKVKHMMAEALCSLQSPLWSDLSVD